MAYALARLGSFDESIDAYRKIMTLRPELTIDAYNEIGIIESLQGRYDAASAAFQKAIDLDSNHTKTTELGEKSCFRIEKAGQRHAGWRRSKGRPLRALIHTSANRMPTPAADLEHSPTWMRSVFGPVGLSLFSALQEAIASLPMRIRRYTPEKRAGRSSNRRSPGKLP